jgi:hypothetical protein
LGRGCEGQQRGMERAGDAHVLAAENMDAENREPARHITLQQQSQSHLSWRQQQGSAARRRCKGRIANRLDASHFHPSPSPRNNPRTSCRASQLFAPRARYRAGDHAYSRPSAPATRNLAPLQPLLDARRPSASALHHAKRETGSRPVQTTPRCGREWPTATRRIHWHPLPEPNHGATGRNSTWDDAHRPGVQLKADPEPEPTMPYPQRQSLDSALSHGGAQSHIHLTAVRFI